MGEPNIIPNAFVLDPAEVSHLIERAARAKAINDCSHVIDDLTLDQSNLGLIGNLYHAGFGPNLKVVSRNDAQLERLTLYYTEAYARALINASAAGPAQTLQQLKTLDRIFESNWEAILRKHRRVNEFNRQETKNQDFWINFTYGTKVSAELAFVLFSPFGKYHFVKGALGGVAFTITCKLCEAAPWDAGIVALGWDKVKSESGDVLEDIGVNVAETQASKFVKKYAASQTEKAGQTLACTLSRPSMLAQIDADKTLALKGVKALGVVAGLLFMADDIKRAYFDGYVQSQRKRKQ